MKFYPEDFDVEVVVPFTDLNGAPIVPTTVSAALFNGDDEQLVDFGNLPLEDGATSKAIVVPRAFNVLEDGELRTSRILRIALNTPAGAVRRSHSYILEAEQRLVPMTNTFMSYDAAEIAALDTPNTSGWNVATEDQRKAAMVEAFARITNIPMRYSPLTTTQQQSSGWDRLVSSELNSEHYIARDQWSEITPELFADLPSHFRKALRRAQFIETNELLQGDNVAKKHRAGIVTETIGESSVTLRAGRIDYGISQQTMAALAGYIHYNMRIARA
ncbi:MAG: hypothetical protein DI537_13800 [Stutzerimonas stutzeri]|nr:MAG: hypothetical protein DI537_13800 [Stutzerimonas stutzeri]